MKKLVAFLRIQDSISDWTGKVIAWSLIVLTMAMIIEVISRDIFDSPTVWAYELSTMLYGGNALLAGAYTHLHNGHVRVDIFYSRFSKRKQAGFDCVMGLLAIIYLVVFFKVSLDASISSVAAREFSPNSSWAPPLYPFKISIAVAGLLLLLQAIVGVIRNFSILLRIKNNAEILKSIGEKG